jgi:hypothetical protein
MVVLVAIVVVVMETIYNSQLSYNEDEYVVRTRCRWFKVLDIDGYPWQRHYNAGGSEVLVHSIA